MSLDATIYNNVNISNAPEQISGVHFVNFRAYKDENKRKLNKIVLFVIMEYGGGNYSVGIEMGVIIFDRVAFKVYKGRGLLQHTDIWGLLQHNDIWDGCNSMTFGDSCYTMTFGNFATH